MTFRSNGEYVPTGISGDFPVVNREVLPSTERRLAVDLQTIRRTEIADKIANGTASPEEEQWFSASLSADVAQGYN